ncbi:MAG: oligosaccharide flippase family protein [Sphingomonadaceae bacterium]
MTSSRVARASIWAIAGGASQYLVTFFLLIYLAQVLSPRDFGLMATVAIGLDLGMQIARWGQIELLQQKRYMNDDARNQALRISLVIALLFAFAFAIFAQPLARFYESPELATMLYLCAPVFILSSLSATAEGILRSQFRFKNLAYRGSVAAVIGGGVAIALAATGFGALALAAQRLVQSVVSGFWVWSAVDWRPNFRSRTPYSSLLMWDGANMMTGSLLPLIVPRSIDLFVSITMGPAALGLLRIAFRIFEFVGQLAIMPLVGVANAQLATLANHPEGLRQSYLRFTQVSATLLCPLMIGFAVVAPEAVPLIFGPNWVSTIPLVQMVSILALTAPPNYFFPTAMIALGQGRLVLRQAIFQVVVGLSLAAVAAQISLTAVLISQIIRGFLITGYTFADLRRHAGLRVREAVRSLAPPYMATAAMAGAMLAVRYLSEGHVSDIAMIALLGAVGAVAYCGTILLGVRLKFWPDFLVAIRRLLPEKWRRFVPA